MRALLALLLPVATIAYDWNCNLYCFHGGECRHGKGKFGSYGNVDDETPWEAKSHVTGMFCSCPLGYTGLQCEISLKGCRTEENGFQHTCFNGNDCQIEKSGEGKAFYHCGCDTDTVFESPYVYKYCEHVSTVFCGHNKNDDTYASSQFCTNGGRCKEPDADGTKHPGCDCPKGWEGLHCTEKVEEDFFQKGKELVSGAASTPTIIAIVMAVIAFLGVTVAFCKYWNRRKRRKRRMREILEEQKYGTGLVPKRKPRRGRRPGSRPPQRRPPASSAPASREQDNIALTSFRDEASDVVPDGEVI